MKPRDPTRSEAVWPHRGGNEGAARRPIGGGEAAARRHIVSDEAASRRIIVGDDAGSMMVVEALLAALIILTAMLFLTNVTKPSPPAAESGLDLEGVARDVLVVLENRPPTVAAEHCPPDGPAVDCYPSRLEEMAGDALGLGRGTFGVTTPAQRDEANARAQEFIGQIVPVGNRWLLRLDNGVEPLVLLPSSGSNVQLTPRAAKAAETFIVPAWQQLAGATDCDSASNPPASLPPGDVLTPGGPENGLAVVAGDTLRAPTGDLPPAGHSSWAQWWLAQQERFVARDAALLANDPDSGLIPDIHRDRIPPTAMYGWWQLNGACHFIGLPAGTATDHPIYGVQLVVWPIAG